MTQTPQQIADEMTRLLADDNDSPLDIIQAQAIQNLQAQAGKQDNMYHGWTPTQSEHERLTNEIEALNGFLKRDPANIYYINRINALERQRDISDAFTDPQPPTEAEQQAAEAQTIDDWLRSDNAAALYGDWSEPSDEYKRMADALRPDPDEPDDLYNYARGG